MQHPRAVDQGAVLRQKSHPVLPQSPQRERALAPSRRQQDRDGALRPGEPERVQAREADRVEMLADASEQEVVDGVVHDAGVLARGEAAVASGLDHRDGASEVIDDRSLRLHVDGAARA